MRFIGKEYMKYQEGDIIQEGNFKGCKVLDSYWEKEMPYKSRYTIEFKGGKRLLDASTLEPDNAIYTESFWKNRKLVESVLNGRNAVELAMFNKTKQLYEGSYFYWDFNNLKTGDLCLAPVKQPDINKHPIPAIVTRDYLSDEEVINAIRESKEHDLSIVECKIERNYNQKVPDVVISSEIS